MQEIVSGSDVVNKLLDDMAVSTLQQEKGISQITLALLFVLHLDHSPLARLSGLFCNIY